MDFTPKVYDFKDMERKGVREIRPIDEKKLLNLSFKVVRDPRSGMLYGIQTGVNKEGQPLFRRITITGRRTYNLEYEEDAKEFAVVKRHQSMLGSPFQKGKPVIKMYDRVHDAEIKLRRMQRGREAMNIALEKLSGNALNDFARPLGISPEDNEPIVVKQLVAERAQKDPETFMRLYDNINRPIIEIMSRGRAVGLIKESIKGGITYKEAMPLGSSEITAIETLKADKNLLMNIDVESKRLAKEKFGEEEPDIVEVKEPDKPKSKGKQKKSDRAVDPEFIADAYAESSENIPGFDIPQSNAFMKDDLKDEDYALIDKAVPKEEQAAVKANKD